MQQTVVVAALLASAALGGGLHAAELRGRVRIDGRPAAGVSVAAVAFEPVLDEARREARGTPPPKPLVTAETGADGRFTLRLAAAPAPAKGEAAQAPSPLDALVRLAFSGAGVTPCRLARVLGADEDAEVGDVGLERARTLAGRVVDDRGVPVAGATVTLSVPCGADTRGIPATATTGADGAFRFTDAAEHDNFLRIEAPGFAATQPTFVPAGTLPKPVALAAGRRAEGRVLRADARTPAAGALVRFEGHATSRWFEAGSDGRFVLEGLPAEKGRVVVRAVDGEAGSAWPLAQDARLELVLGPGGRLSGRVLDAVTRAPLPRRRVVARGQGASFPALSGSDGRYELRALPVGTYTLSADDARYVPWQSERVPVEPDAAARQDILLVSAAALRGRVVDETGAPVEGACGRLLPPDVGDRPSLSRTGGRAADVAFCSAKDGSFSATRVAPGRRLRLSVSHDDFEPRVVSGLELEAGRPPTQVSVVLRRGLVLRGSVRDVAGKPVAEAAAVLAGAAEARPGRFGAADRYKSGKTGADGTFELRGLTPGDYSLEIRRAGYANGQVDSIALSRAHPPEPIEVVLEPGAMIAGFVRDGRDRPVEGLPVTALPSGGHSQAGRMLVAQGTGPDGSFAINGVVPGASYDLVMLDAFPPMPLATGVTAPAEGVELRVPGSGQGRIRGIVTDAESGRPLSEFAVSCDSGRESRGRVFPRSSGRGAPGGSTAVHAADGRFVLEDVDTGTWDVTARAAGYLPGRVADVTVEEGADTPEVEVRLTRGAVLSGRVLETASGRPVADALVRAQAADDEQARFSSRASNARTDGDGRFRIEGLAPRSYVVTASHPEWSETSRSVVLGADGSDSVELRLGRGGVLAGVVTSGGRPLAGASVALTSAAAAHPASAFFADAADDLSDDAGRFRFEHLAAGRYTLSATLNARPSPPVAVVLAAGQSREDLRLELSGGATVNGRVTGLPETQLAGIIVSASGDGDYFATARTRAGGAFEILGVPAGPLALYASANSSLSSARSASVRISVPEALGEIAAEIRFEGGLRLDGHVTRAGQPVTSVNVTAFRAQSGGVLAMSSTDSSGAFALEGLREGTYEVFVQPFSGGTTVRRTVDLQGDQTLDVELPSARVAGTVVDADTRRPLGDAQVSAAGSENPGVLLTAITDSNGRFAFQYLAQGAYRVTASRSAYASETRTLTAGDGGPDVEIELRPGERLMVVARDVANGTPLGGLLLNVLDATGAQAYAGSVALDSDGRGEASSLRPGVYELRASAPGYAPLFLPGVAVPSAPLSLGLTAGGTLELRCGPQTLARPAARARLVDAAGRPLLPTIFSSTPDVPLRQPVRRLANVPPGRYALVLDTGGEPAMVELRAGATSVVTLP